MRFRTGLIVGLGAGYYLGTKAGRERYEQINRWIDRVRASETYETATEKARAVVDLGVERARDLVGDKSDGGTDPADGAAWSNGEAAYPSSR